MMTRKIFLSEINKKLLLGVITMVILFLGFHSNTWHVAKQEEFRGFPIGSDSLVAGRLVKSRQDGVLSAGGLTGAGVSYNIHEDWISGEDIAKQYTAYLDGRTFSDYSPYLSQIGGQAMIFSLLDSVLPLSSQVKLNLFYILTSFTSALALTLIILWFYDEFGLLVAIFVFGAMVFSPLLTLFGRTLWWSVWAFYLPMIAVMEFLKYNQEATDHFFLTLGVVILLAVFFKCFINGYEFITTTLIMMMTPLVYYGVRDRLTIRQFLKGMLVALFFSGLAILLSFTILSVQIGALKGGTLLNGAEHIAASFIKRTYGDASQYTGEYAASLKASTIDVVIKYLKGTFINIRNYVSINIPFLSRIGFKIRYMYLIVIFFAMSVLALWHNSKNVIDTQKQKVVALISATWFSILAPLSWYVIFKSHSFIHTSINNILWHMPFVLFGFAVCGLVIKDLLSFASRVVRSH